ncbi:hypothetical protein ACSSV9_14205 [Melioribacter sp. OK-6-Me]|uniref:hypothetical protein n=1 Tax=Melioribacter sp. OK-6-Me TaxID=3423433 RepID=UPI003EDAF94F
MDFTLKTYQKLLQSFLQNNYQFIPFVDYLENNSTSQHLNNSTQQLVILRHDVDRLPQNALQTANIEHDIGIKGTYYFRIVPESYDLSIMEKIVKLGHEIGYHYEDVDLVRSGNSSNHLIDRAYESFCKNLENFRKNFDIKTICMHGSPRSPYDNKLIWEKYDYRTLGILGEPYLDINFNEFAYFTDTGRRWNGNNVSLRDKVNTKFIFNYKSTFQLISNFSKMPDKIMITIHPERWTNKFNLWLKELLLQNVKNVIKRSLILRRNNTNTNKKLI